MIAKVCQICQAASLLGTLHVWRSHVSWVLVENVGNGSLILGQVVLPLFGGQGLQIKMGPGMRSDLMAILKHAFNGLHPLLGRVNLTSSVGDAWNEEGGLRLSFMEYVQKLFSFVPRTIVKGQCDDSWFRATDDGLPIRHCACLCSLFA